MRVRNLTVMFTDMKGFTAATSRRSRKELATLLETHEKITREAVEVNNGEIIKNLGDGFLAVFASSTNALLAAKYLQKKVQEYDLNTSDNLQFELKVALASGDVIFENDDVFGEPVNIASRVLALVEPGQIYFTQSVYLAMNKNELVVEEVGERQLRGISEPIRIYQVRQKGSLNLNKFLADARSLLQRNLVRDIRYAFLLIFFILLFNGFGERESVENVKGFGDVQIPASEGVRDLSLSPSPNSSSVPAAVTLSSSPPPTNKESAVVVEEKDDNFLERLLKNGKGQFKGLLKKLGLE